MAFVGVVVAAALLLAGGATARTAATPSAQLPSAAQADRYLGSLGLDAAGFVVQHGPRNYAGPKCPGKGWNCTKAKRVLQIATGGGVNAVNCSASGGSGSRSSSAGSASVSCTIVQTSTSGANSATCAEQSALDDDHHGGGSMTQTCSITQTSTSGTNSASIAQTLQQGPGSCSPPHGDDDDDQQTQSGTQSATVIQSSPAGGASANVTQTASQCAVTDHHGAAAQSQTTYQEFTVRQGPVGWDPASASCPAKTGTLGATVTQSQHQRGYATAASSGTQSQRADLIGHVDQCSSDHADYTASQNEDQFLAPNAHVAQTQIGPAVLTGRPAPQGKRSLQRGSCCSFQGVNPTDFCTITQTTSQVANPTAGQTENLSTSAGTSGSCTGNVSATENGATTATTQTGSSVSAGLTCQSQVCVGAQAPTALVWSPPAPSGTYHDAATLAATLTRTDTNAPVSGQTVQLATGNESCTAVTDGSGLASCSATLTDKPGAYPATATFAATPSFLGSSTTATFTVLKQPTTLTYTGPATAAYHDTVPLSAHLLEADTGYAVDTTPAPRSVTFTLGTQTCTGTADATGTATCDITITQTPGSAVSLGVDFAGDDWYAAPAAEPTAAFTITKAPTTLSYTGDASADYNDPATLAATLTETDTGAPVDSSPQRSVAFKLGTQSCSGSADASGAAACTISPVTQTPGSVTTVGATFDGSADAYYLSSTASSSFAITKEESAVTYTGVSSADFSDPATLSAKLTEDGVTPLQGRTLTLALGTQSCTGTTNSSGVAKCTLTVNQPAGSATAVASFAGDAFYAAGSGSAPFTITQEEDSLSYTGATSGKKGHSVTLSARLTHGSGLSGRTIAFTIGSQSCSATTSSSGTASCSITLSQGKGGYTVKAAFAGDAYYAAVTASRSFSISS